MSLGLLGSVGLLRSRYGPQLVPSGVIGFAYGVALGLFVSAAFLIFRRGGFRQAWTMRLVAVVGAVAILGLFLLLSH